MSKRHSIIAIILLFAIVLSLSACSLTPRNDKGFITNMQKGLEARWKISTKSSNPLIQIVMQKEQYTKLVNTELKAIGDISAYKFEDKELEALANQYYAALQNQLEGIKYYDTNESKYIELFGRLGLGNRERIICKLYDDYGLTVSEKYSEVFSELVSEGRMLLEMDKLTSDGFVLESIGGSNYEFVITNTSDSDLSNVKIEFNFYDDNNVLVDDAISFIDSWKAGSTNQCSIYVKNDFTKAEARISFTANNSLSTEFFPVECVRKTKIEITLRTSLPCSATYSSNSKILTKCTVSSFDYDISNWNAGKATVELKISGKKTYDAKSNSYSRAVKIGWKLYDENGNVVDSGIFHSSQIRVGETFSGISDNAYKIAPGSYTLELLNVT